jgi:hypothetical protein
LEQIAGFWPDIEKSRAEARRLLRRPSALPASRAKHSLRFGGADARLGRAQLVAHDGWCIDRRDAHL